MRVSTNYKFTLTVYQGFSGAHVNLKTPPRVPFPLITMFDVRVPIKKEDGKYSLDFENAIGDHGEDYSRILKTRTECAKLLSELERRAIGKISEIVESGERHSRPFNVCIQNYNGINNNTIIRDSEKGYKGRARVKRPSYLVNR